jgi:hypothetical protein
MQREQIYALSLTYTEADFEPQLKYDLLHRIRTGCVFHPFTYPVRTEGKAAGA